MSFYNYEPPFPVGEYAKARVDGAESFRMLVVENYIRSYRDFWCLDRPEVSPQNLQAIFDELGAVALEILTDSATFIGAISQAFPDDLEDRYKAAPYEYTITPDGRLIIGELKDEWQQATD